MLLFKCFLNQIHAIDRLGIAYRTRIIIAGQMKMFGWGSQQVIMLILLMQDLLHELRLLVLC